MIKKLIVLLLFMSLSFVLLADNNDTYVTPYRLFHVERSKNKNIVCYDVNVVNSRLDKSSPINVYWVNREERMGETNGLSAIQRRLAFGYKLRSNSEYTASIALNACSDREMKVEQHDGKYRCLMDINNNRAVLQKIYVKTKSSNSLKVEYVELTGVLLSSGQTVSEKIYN